MDELLKVTTTFMGIWTLIFIVVFIIFVSGGESE